MSWLYRRLLAIVSILTCLVFFGGLQPASLAPAMREVLSNPAAAQPEHRLALSVAVVNCVEGGQGVGESTRLRLYRWADNQYPLVDQKELVGSTSAKFTIQIGGYWLVTTREGCARSAQWLSVDGASSLRVKVQLQRAHSLRVLVRNEDKVPIANALVLGWGESPLAYGARTKSNGIAKLVTPVSGVVRVTVQAPGYESAEVSPGPDGVDIVLRQLGSLEVQVQDTEGKPVSGAAVHVAGFAFSTPLEVISDERGIASIHGLERGSYDLRAHAGSQVSQSRLGFVLGRGQNRKLTLVLVPGRFVSVKVVDGAREDADSVAGAEVVVVEDGLGPFPLHGRTDERGRVQLGPLPFSPAVLNVRADGFVSRSGIEISLQSTKEQLVELLAGGVLSGVVVNSAGQPVVGAQLEVVGNDVFGRPIAARAGNVAVRRGFFEQAAPGALALAPVGELGVVPGALASPASRIGMRSNAAPWVTDDNGYFSLKDVPPGRLRVFVRHPDYVEVLSSATSLAPGGTAQLRVVLPVGAQLNGAVVDAQGHSVEGARVDVIAQRGSGHQTSYTDDSGRFEFKDVSQLVQVTVARPEDPHRFVVERRVEMAPGEVREVQLVLPSERPASEITVLDPHGQWVDDARVSLLSLDPNVPLRLSLFVDDEGRVVMEDAAGLKVELKVRSLRFMPFSVRLAALPEEYAVELNLGASVRGEVTHVRGRLGLSGARVTWTQGSVRQEVLTDETGEYRFADVGLGRASLSVSKQGYSSETQELELRSEQLRSLQAMQLPTVNLVEGGSVSGVIVDSRGTPVPSARVGRGLIPAFLPVGSSPAGFVQTDPQGRFLLSGLPSGPVSLSAYAVDVGRGRVEDVEVSAGDLTEDVMIQLGGHHPDTEPGSLGNAAITLGARRLSAGVEVVVVHVATGSEAEAAGLEMGDILEEVDGAACTNLVETRAQLGGPEGSDVVVGLRRGSDRFHVRLRREAVRR